MGKQPEFKIHELTRAALDALYELGEGEILPYPVLAKALKGLDPRTEGYGYVASARRILRDQHQRNYDAVPTVGIVRLRQEDNAKLGPAETAKIRRATRRQIKRLQCFTDSTGIAVCEVHKHSAYLSQLRFLESLSTTVMSRRFEQHAVNGVLPDPPDMDLFKGL